MQKSKFIPVEYFDKYFNFTHYFPHNNLRAILRKIEDTRLMMLTETNARKSKRHNKQSVVINVKTSGNNKINRKASFKKR